MPTISEADSLLLRLIETWTLAARDAVEDIGAWREEPQERMWHGGWPTDGYSFGPNTALLIARLSNRTTLDLKSLQRIHDVITTWNARRDAKNLSDQAELEVELEKALVLTASVRDGIVAGDQSPETTAAVANSVRDLPPDRCDPDPQPPYMPSSWFTDTFGIPASRLRSARRDGRLPANDVGKKRPRYQYSVPAAMRLWPDDGIYLPSTDG